MDSALQASMVLQSAVFCLVCNAHQQKHTAERQKKAGRIHRNSPVLYQTILIKDFLFLSPPHKMQLNEKLYM